MTVRGERGRQPPVAEPGDLRRAGGVSPLLPNETLFARSNRGLTPPSRPTDMADLQKTRGERGHSSRNPIMSWWQRRKRAGQLHDADPEVRRAAVDALAALGDAKSVRLLADALLGRDLPDVQAHAAIALKQIGP